MNPRGAHHVGLMPAALIGGGIFVGVILIQFSRREHTLKGLAKPLVAL